MAASASTAQAIEAISEANSAITQADAYTSGSTSTISNSAGMPTTTTTVVSPSS